MLRSDGTTDRILITQVDMRSLTTCGFRHDADVVPNAPVPDALDIQRTTARMDWRTTGLMETDSSKNVDVLVTYTQLRENQEGGPEEIRATAEHSVAYTNQVLENSCLAHRQVRLAGVVNLANWDPYFEDATVIEDASGSEIGYDEISDRIEDLYANNLDEYQADTTTLYLAGGELRHPNWVRPIIGLGSSIAHYTGDFRFGNWRATNPALDFYNYRRERLRKTFAPNSKVWGGASTFAHEWGHNMGIGHDRPDKVGFGGSSVNRLRPTAWGTPTYLGCQWGARLP